MKAAVLTGIRQIEVRDVAEPAIQADDQVLLKIEAVGICGSDVHYYNEGCIGSQIVQYPWTIGHECAGTVVKVGGGVTQLKVGQRVAVDPQITCNRCDQCLGGRENTCRHGKFLGNPGQASGAMAQYLVMPAKSCFAIPSSVTFEEAAMCEPLAIGVYAARTAALKEGSRVAILGSGPIGLSVLLALRAGQGIRVEAAADHAGEALAAADLAAAKPTRKARHPSHGARPASHGAVRTYVTDLIDRRLETARDLGADWTGSPLRQDVVEDIRQRESDGMDCVFECAGRQETIDHGIALLKPGGALYAIGIPRTRQIAIDFDRARREELSVRAIRRQNQCEEATIGLVATGRVDIAPLATHHFPLADVRQAMETVLNYRDGVIKAILHLG